MIRRLPIALTLLVLAVGNCVHAVDSARTISPTAADVAGLSDTLSKGLRARRPKEFAFINKVVQYVEMDKLKRKMVLETFHWARRKAGVRRSAGEVDNTRYPFPYFERAMKIRAARIGVKL